MFQRTLTLACTVLALAATGAAPADWPQFLGPLGNGSASDGKLARTWPAEGPRVIWQCAVKTGFGGAAIAAGKVYLLDRDGEAGDVLRCLDFADGREVWSYAYDAPGKLSYPGSRSTPAVDAAHVYTVGPFGHVQCIDLATHRPVWTHNLVKDFGGRLPNWGVTQSPLLYKNWVVLAPQNEQVGVVAYETATGRVAWKSAPVGSWETAYASPMLATVDGLDQIVMLSQVRDKKRINVVGVNPADGQVLWTFDHWTCGIPIPQPVACGGGRFFITGGYNANSAMFQVEKQDGVYVTRELFNACAPEGAKPEEIQAAAGKPGADCSSHFHTPVFYKDCLFANGNSRQNKSMGLVCLGLDGLTKWKTGAKFPAELGDLIRVDDLLLALDGEGGTLRLVEASPAAFKELASARVLDQKHEVWAPMAFADGKLLVRSATTLKCLDLR